MQKYAAQKLRGGLSPDYQDGLFGERLANRGVLKLDPYAVVATVEIVRVQGQTAPITEFSRSNCTNC